MQAAMQAAGFVGIEAEGSTIFARSRADLPEFSAQDMGGVWLFSMRWPLRADLAQIAGWNALYPDAKLDTETGETRLQMRGGVTDLARWAKLCDAMVLACAGWRRGTRQRDEGM